ncbi:MAG: hypothetical protein A2X52_22415 [Candidatus Rokubacteria bacterium GWC2_70_16]|nr:MAG: hypothetical protein A2X52_22415 [Candidatus Rokubacteria bacterium GWC2_70_16]OGL17929.1 MAG: hypothetical protein A3K12_16935 [Candidatus Rokubacteria bacterium RIFCSPLOWO2_12_FULL_71_19]
MAGTDDPDPTTRGRRGKVFLAEVGGPVLTLAVVATVEFVSRTEFPIPAAAAVYLLVVALVTHSLGLRAGLLSAAVAVAYQAYFLSTPGEVFRYSPESLQRVLLLAATASAAALLIGLLKRQVERSDSAVAERTRQVAEGEAALQARLREMSALLAISRVVGGAVDLPEGLRLVCREVARLTGAQTVAAHVLDAGGAVLRPVAGYHVPKEHLEILARTTLPVSDLGALRSGVLGEGSVVWSEEVPDDPRFAFGLARALPHQSAVVVPLGLEGEVSGALYLVWWTERRRLDDAESATLRAIGQQVEILLRSARLHAALEFRAGRLRTLARLGQTVSSSLDMGEVLAAIARAAADLMSAPFVSVWVADEGARMLTLRAVSDEAIAGDLPLSLFGYGEGGVGWIAEQRRPLEVPDIWADDRFFAQEWWQAHGLRSFYGVPIVLDGRLLGVLALGGREPFRFGRDERDLLDSFVAQVAVAIRNAWLYAESSRQAERLQTVTRLTRAITASLDQVVILPAVAETAVSLFPGAACRLWTVEGHRVRMRAQSGIRDEGGEAPAETGLGEGLAGRVCAGGDRLLLEDIYAHADLVGADWLRSQGLVSAAVLPLVVGTRRVGAFCLFTREPHAFDPGEVAVLDAIAEHAAVALEKARLFQDTQERRRLSEKLYAMAVSMESSMDLQSRLDEFVEATRGALGFDRCSVGLATPDGATLELVAGTDLGPGGRRPVPLLDGGGAFQAVWESGETLLVSADVTLGTLPPLAPQLCGDPLLRSRRFAVIPLKFRSKTLGLVAVDNKQSRRPITPRAVAQLQLFCQQLAQSLGTVRLYIETQEREREATLLFDVTRRLSATLDFNEVLDIVADCTIEALKCAAAGFFGWDALRNGLYFIRGRGIEAGVRRDLVLAPGEGVVGRAYVERRPVWTHDRLDDPGVTYSPAGEALLRSAGRFRASLAVPVLIRDEVVGALVAHRHEPRDWREPEIRLLSSIAAQAAVAMENARLYTETQHNLAGAALLNEAARMLHRTLDVHRLLPETLASVGRTFGALGCALVLFDEGAAGRWPVIHWGSWADGAARALGEVLRRREAPLVVPDVAARPDVLPPEARPAEPVGIAAFPIRGRSRVLAGLVLVFPAARALTEADKRLLAAYADQLAMALDNATLFEEAENKRTQLEQVFASTSDGFLVLDLDGRIVALNRQGGTLLGIAPDEVLHRPLALLLDRLAPARVPGSAAASGLEAVLAGGAEAGDLELAAPASRTIRWHATPTRDLLGAPVGATVTLRDVTREREIDRMKTEFVSTVSHELRTPLTSIKGSLHLLLTDPGLVVDDVQRHLIEISLSNTDRLVRLINDILDISKIEAGQIQLRLEPRPPREFVAAAVEGIAALAESRAILVEQVVPEDLPRVSVDLDRMIQVLTNLLSNAVKFSPPGSRVTVSAGRAGERLELRVTDRGRGIAPADVDKLFQKFRQLDASAMREVGGTGLGLAICRGIVEEHGGAIVVESQPGAGATFIVRLPLPAEAAAPQGEAPPAAEAPLILVVDDEPDLREAIREQLEILGGYRVVEAGRALEAVEVARLRRPDLITMDLMLPDLDGLEAVRLLREQQETRETPVVMVTAIELEEGKFGPAGPTACIVKPFTTTTLLDTVRAHLRGPRAERP